MYECKYCLLLFFTSFCFLLLFIPKTLSPCMLPYIPDSSEESEEKGTVSCEA